MGKLELTSDPVANTAMLIRKPVSVVFEAFIDPKITSKFWFTGGSGKLEADRKVKWSWAMYGVSADVDVLEVEKGKRILIGWQGYTGPTKVEWVFTPVGDDATFVEITERGFGGDGDTRVKAALDSTGGFTWALAGAKAWLEYAVQLNLVADRHPKDLW
jgi:uncharacterized protein YndB with AHSA1/START domain